MEIFLNALFLIIGMVLLIKGADFFVSGASAIAKRLKVPSMFIGLTIVALGTSLPEFSVSVTSAISGSLDMSVGNIVGSNLFNMLFILGVVALFSPIVVSSETKKTDFPFLIVVTSLLLLFGLDSILDGADVNILSRIESVMFIAIVALYLFVLIRNAKQSRKEILKTNPLAESEEQKESKEKVLKIWQIVLFMVGGLAAVVFGGECVSTTAKFLAIEMGMSEALVGLTIVAMGTSLPELATSVIAAKKGEKDIALGNVIGSNILNISLILGTVGLINQVTISTIILTDMAILLAATIVFVLMCAKRENLTKKHGIILLAMYFAYIAFAIIRNYCF